MRNVENCSCSSPSLPSPTAILLHHRVIRKLRRAGASENSMLEGVLIVAAILILATCWRRPPAADPLLSAVADLERIEQAINRFGQTPDRGRLATQQELR